MSEGQAAGAGAGDACGEEAAGLVGEAPVISSARNVSKRTRGLDRYRSAPGSSFGCACFLGDDIFAVRVGPVGPRSWWADALPAFAPFGFAAPSARAVALGLFGASPPAFRWPAGWAP